MTYLEALKDPVIMDMARELAPLLITALMLWTGIMVLFLCLTRPKRSTNYHAYNQTNVNYRASRRFSALPRVFGRFVGKVGLYQANGRHTGNDSATELAIAATGSGIDRFCNPATQGDGHIGGSAEPLDTRVFLDYLKLRSRR